MHSLVSNSDQKSEDNSSLTTGGKLGKNNSGNKRNLRNLTRLGCSSAGNMLT